MMIRMDEDLEAVIGQMTDLWVFGYGSILWQQGFSSDDQLVGYVDGYVRRFWQGNTTHRGTTDTPGRVATLIEQPEGRVWGVAYHLRGSNQIRLALDHLGVRECLLGGYICQALEFTERTKSLSDDTPRKLPVLAFIATPMNALFLGPTDLDSMASHVIACRGNSGTNVEYVIRLAEFVHANIPEDDDEHLFILEQKIKEKLQMNAAAQMPNLQRECSYISLTLNLSIFSAVDCRQNPEAFTSFGLCKEKMLEQLMMASSNFGQV